MTACKICQNSRGIPHYNFTESRERNFYVPFKPWKEFWVKLREIGLDVRRLRLVNEVRNGYIVEYPNMGAYGW